MPSASEEAIRTRLSGIATELTAEFPDVGFALMGVVNVDSEESMIVSVRTIDLDGFKKIVRHIEDVETALAEKANAKSIN